MRLSSLKLSGFKSFADSTTLHFKENRTAVVGPNGCGKSNVIDAIRWVMGESSARQLRGGSMQDVIFTGTAKRKPVGMASVELRFENTYGKLGGAYNAYTELAVRRQVNREGKSEYFLNGTRCRRRDITDIFLGTGLGPRSYAIIEQGMINRLVEAKPEDMRVFIEEAAGISRYQARRRETAQHLEHTQQNLERLDDIAQELKTQMRSLSRQAEAAQHYRQLEDNILTLKVEILSYQAEQAQFQQEKHTLALSELGDTFKLVRSELTTVEHDLEQTTALFQRIVSDSAPLQQQWQQAEQKRSKLKNDVEHKQRISQSNRHKLKHLDEEKHRLKQNIQVLELQLETLHDEHDAAQELHATTTSTLAEKQQVYTDLKRQATDTQQHYLQTQQQQQQWFNQQQNMQQQLQQIEKNLQRIQAQQEQLNGQQQAQREDVDAQLEQLFAQEHTLQGEMNALETAVQRQQQHVTELEAEKVQAQQALRGIEDELQRIDTEVKTLQSLMHAASAQIEEEFTGTRLWQQIRLTDAGKPHAALIEKVYTNWMQAAYLEEGQGFHQQLYLQVQAAQTTHSQVQNDALRAAAALQWSQAGLIALTDWIEHPQVSLWQQVWICPDYATACQHRHLLSAGQSLLSLDGYHVGRDWQVALHIANPHAQLAPQGQLGYQVQLDALLPLLDDKQQQCQAARMQLTALEQHYETQRDALKQLQQQQQQQQAAQQQRQLEQSKLESLKQAYAQQHLQQREQARLLEQAYDDEAMLRDELDIDLHALQMKLDQLAPQLKANDMAWSNVQSDLERDEADIQQLQHAAQQAQVDLQHKHSQIQLLEKDLTFLRQSYQQVIEQIQQAQHYLAPVQEELPHLESELEQHTLATEKLQQDLSSAQTQLTEVQQKQHQLNLQRQQLQQQDDELRAGLEQTRLQWHSAKTEHQHLLSQLTALNHSIRPNLDIDLADHQQKLQQLQQKFEKIGPVNLAAAIELDEIKQRYDELSHQIDDLQTTVQQLHDAMKSIDQETKKLFMSTFDLVNAELQDLFPKVFEGGEASLSLEEDWQSGVKLMARPPGKKNTSLALLSGGEKALTALALVFAIFRLNPAPFCVLDEVDAPLDDANVKRFCNLVKELSDQVQFIYITHNKVAMTMATTLLGVTMPEPGTSKLVTVDLAHAEAYGLVRES